MTHPNSERITELSADLLKARSYQKNLKTASGKKALDKLRYILVVTIHNLEMGQ